MCVCVWDGVRPQWKADAQGKFGFVNKIREGGEKKPELRLLFVECNVLPGLFVKQCEKGNTFSFSHFPIFFHGTMTMRVCVHVLASERGSRLLFLCIHLLLRLLVLPSGVLCNWIFGANIFVLCKHRKKFTLDLYHNKNMK